MNKMGQHFQTLDDARSRPAEICRPVCRKDMSRFCCRQFVYAFQSCEDAPFLSAAVEAKTAARQNNNFGSNFQYVFPVEPVRGALVIGKMIGSASNLDQFFHPVTSAIKGIDPFQTENAWPGQKIFRFTTD